MSELRFEDVSVRYGTRRRGLTAVDGVSLTVPDGEVVGLVGESGSGKSTLARAAVGLAPVSGGAILLDGRPVPLSGRRRPVQLVFQDPYSSLDPRRTISASIGETIPARDPITGASLDRRAEAARLLELVELDANLARAFPGELSGGQRQRVALARALGARPDVVIADEITSALDVSIQGAVLNLLRTLLGELGTSMLVISHNLAVVRYVATSIAVMYLGRIVEHGPAAEVLANPQHPYTRDLLAAVPDPSRPPSRETKPAAGATVDAAPAVGVTAGVGPGAVADAVAARGAAARATATADGQLALAVADAAIPAAADIERIEWAARAVADAEPADPHHPPAGCRYHPWCPIGPVVRPERTICRTEAPSTDHRHHAACHFAGSATALVAAGGDPTEQRSPR